MNLILDNWQLKTDSIEQKQALFDLAKDCGVPTASIFLGYRDDIDPYISWFGASIGLGSLPRRHEYRRTEICTEHEFRQACEAFKLAHTNLPATQILHSHA